MNCICFTFTNPKTKKPYKVCWCPPVLVDPWWRFRPEDPRWLEFEGIKAKELDDLALLSTLSTLTEQLSPALAKRLQAPIKEVLQAQLQKLPVEAQLEQHSAARK